MTLEEWIREALRLVECYVAASTAYVAGTPGASIRDLQRKHIVLEAHLRTAQNISQQPKEEA